MFLAVIGVMALGAVIVFVLSLNSGKASEKPSASSTYSYYELVAADLNGKGVSDAMLADMVKSGEIPENIEVLYLKDNQITDLTPLAGLKDLNTLDLTGNQISDISSLARLLRLKNLLLGNNQISDIAPVSALSNLANLSLVGNPVSDASWLYKLKKLSLVDLTNTPIAKDQKKLQAVRDALPGIIIRPSES
jgi:Leucine-rich repeat (LRR) protein